MGNNLISKGGGHYWAFLYSKSEECWYKYDDTTVSKVAEELVWKESYGGHGNQSAYCLIYLSNQNSFECPDDAYTIIPLQVQVKIAEDNQEFDEEIMQWDLKVQRDIEEAEKRRLHEIEERNRLLAMQEEQRHHAWIGGGGNHDNQISLSEFELDKFYHGFVEDIDAIKNDVPSYNIDLIPNLMSFAAFLYSVQFNDLFKFEVAEQRSLKLYNLPLRSKSSLGFYSPAAAKIITKCQLHPITESHYLAYRQIYDNCFTVLEYFAQALQLIVDRELVFLF